MMHWQRRRSKITINKFLYQMFPLSTQWLVCMANLSHCLSAVFLLHFVRLVLSLYISLLSSEPKSGFYLYATVNWTSGKKIEDLQLSWKFILDVFAFLSNALLFFFCLLLNSLVCSCIANTDGLYTNQTKYTYCIFFHLNFNILFQLRVCVHVLPKIYTRVTWSESIYSCAQLCVCFIQCWWICDLCV